MKRIFLALSLISTLHANTPKAPITIAYVGDSLTEGFGIEQSASYPTLVDALLKKKGYDIKTINAGISGSTSASAASRVKWVLKANPSWIVIALGANDGLRGLKIEEMKKNLLAATDLALQAKVQVLFIGMKMPANLGNTYARNFEKAFHDIAKSRKVHFIPFLLEGVAGNKDLNQGDSIHPNEKGHKIVAENVLKFFEAHL